MKKRPTNTERIRRSTELRIVHHIEALIACDEALHGYGGDFQKAMKMVVVQISQRRHR